jgi:hypothetical protein
MTSMLGSNMKDGLKLPTPAAKIRTLENDGCVRIQVGEFVGTVSSMHLVEPKILQLQEYWRKAHQPERF